MTGLPWLRYASRSFRSMENAESNQVAEFVTQSTEATSTSSDSSPKPTYPTTEQSAETPAVAYHLMHLDSDSSVSREVGGSRPTTTPGAFARPGSRVSPIRQLPSSQGDNQHPMRSANNQEQCCDGEYFRNSDDYSSRHDDVSTS